MRQQRQQENTAKVQINGLTIRKVGRKGVWQVTLRTGKVVTGNKSKCISAVLND